MDMTNTSDKEKDREQLKAAYALNMCTVSISQIVQYNDVYILEQEYNAILNNLNLEKMPKDEALLTILTEILNTITFFRIQDKKKQQIEKQYQRAVKDAIWNAVPNIGMVMANSAKGDIVTWAISLGVSMAVQVGAGYMNYRKAKAVAAREKEKEETELEIVALEQFNALRRELFTTAWRLAKEHEYPERYRLTENQIKQYNDILMDTDDVRRYERLEAIEKFFEAYPPFRYQIGHTAASIATTPGRYDEKTRRYYLEEAKKHFEAYYKGFNEYGLDLLREDQMVSSYALEYIDLLLAEHDNKTLTNIDEIRQLTEKITKLLQQAEDHAGNACDVLQLCAIGYLRIREPWNAGRLLRNLVNENYNAQANAKLLSKVYSALALEALKSGKDTEELWVKYELLENRMGSSVALFPMPDSAQEDQDAALKEYMNVQRTSLAADYQDALNEFQEKYEKEIRRLLFPVSQCGEREDSFFATTDIGEELRRETMVKMLRHAEDFGSAVELQRSYLDTLNKALSDLNSLKPFREKRYHFLVEKSLVAGIAKTLRELQKHAEQSEFTIDGDYAAFNSKCAFSAATDDMMKALRTNVEKYILSLADMDELNNAETELLTFCQKSGITPPYHGEEKTELSAPERNGFLSYSLLLSDTEAVGNEEKRFESGQYILSRYADKLIFGGKKQISLLQAGTDSNAFSGYFQSSGRLKKDIPLRKSTFAILRLGKFDLLFTTEGLRDCQRPNDNSPYSSVVVIRENNKCKLRLSGRLYNLPDGVDPDTLEAVLKELRNQEVPGQVR